MILNPYRYSAGTGYVLDDYTGATAGYSLRALSASYQDTNPVVQLFRASSPRTANFTATEVTDGTMEAWVTDLGDTEGYVRALFNQTGGANAISNFGSDNEQYKPLLVSGGVLLADGLKFDGVNEYMDTQIVAGSASAQSIFVVAQTSDLTANRILVDGRDANDDGPALFFLGGVDDTLRYSVDSTTNNTGNDLFTSALSVNTEYLFSSFYAGNATPSLSTLALSLDGVEEDTATSAPASISTTTNYLIGRAAYTSSAFWQGNIQEVIIYPDDQSANQSGIDGNIKTAYGIT